MTYAELVRMFLSARRRARFAEVAGSRLQCLTMVFDHIVDPHNENACIRVADSFGVGVTHHLADAAYRRNHRVSMASDRWVEVRDWNEPGPLVTQLREEGFVLYGAVVPADGGVPYEQAELPARLAVVVGSERHGLTPPMRALCDELVHIPTFGFVDSLNLSTAAAILIQHYSARYRRRGGPGVFLDDAAREALVARWIEADLRAKLRARGKRLEDFLT